MKYRAIIYDKSNESFWKFSRLYDSKEKALIAGKKIAKKYKVSNFDLRITELVNVCENAIAKAEGK